MNKSLRIFLSLLALYPSKTYASLHTPFVAKGTELLNSLTFISKIICAVGLMVCLIMCAVDIMSGSSPRWGRICLIGIVSVAIGGFGMIRSFIGA